MFYVFNKQKISSYLIISSMALMLLVASILLSNNNGNNIKKDNYKNTMGVNLEVMEQNV